MCVGVFKLTSSLVWTVESAANVYTHRESCVVALVGGCCVSVYMELNDLCAA